MTDEVCLSAVGSSISPSLQDVEVSLAALNSSIKKIEALANNDSLTTSSPPEVIDLDCLSASTAAAVSCGQLLRIDALCVHNKRERAQR